MWPLFQGLGEAVAGLRIEFGDQHPLIESYVNAWKTVADATNDFASMENADQETRMANLNKIADGIVAAGDARKVWLNEAEKAIDALN